MNPYASAPPQRQQQQQQYHHTQYPYGVGHAGGEALQAAPSPAPLYSQYGDTTPMKAATNHHHHHHNHSTASGSVSAASPTGSVDRYARARQPDGSLNPHLMFLPDANLFDPGVAVPSVWDGVGNYMKPRRHPDPRYIEPPAAGAANDPSLPSSGPTSGASSAPPMAAAASITAQERRERAAEHGRLIEYRRRLGLDGPRFVPEEVRNYEPRPRPKWVPFVVRPTWNHDVHWTPPPPESPPRIDISTADAVEVPIAPRDPTGSGDDVLGAHAAAAGLVAYDDGDPFPFPVRPLRPPPADVGAPPLEYWGRSPATAGGGALTLVHHHEKILLFTPDRRRVYQLRVGAPQEGWSTVELMGQPPPAESILVPIGYAAVGAASATTTSNVTVNTTVATTHIAAFSVGDRVVVLSMQNRTWISVIVPDFRLVAAPIFAHTVIVAAGPNAHREVYVRSIDEHFVVTFERIELRDHEEPRPGDDMEGIKRLRVCAWGRRLRSTPVDDVLVPVPFAPGVATSTTVGRRGEIHTWVFLYEPKAFNWLPHERIEFGQPMGVALGHKVLFFANDISPAALQHAMSTVVVSGSGKAAASRAARSGVGVDHGGTCVCASLNLESRKVVQPPTSADVRIMIGTTDILALAPTRRAHNTVLLVTADCKYYVILEVDRWEKIKGYVFRGEHDYDDDLDPSALR